MRAIRPKPALFLPLILVGLVSCEPEDAATAPARPPGRSAEPEEPGLVVRVTKPRRQTMDRALEVTGDVVALHVSEVSCRVAGLPVVEVLAEVDDRVEKGQELARLDGADLDQAYAEAEAAHVEAGVRVREADLTLKELIEQARSHQTTIAQKKAVLDRIEAQEAQGAAAGEDLENARFDYDKELGHAERLKIQIAKARVSHELAKLAEKRALLEKRKAERERGYDVVAAPFDGVVSERLANVGLLPSMGQTLFRVFDPESLVVEAHLPQGDLRDLGKGLPAELTSEALGGTVLEAELTLVSPVVADDGTVMVRLTPEQRSELKPGLFVSGRIVLESRPDTLVVPRKAVAYERERPYVYVVDEVQRDDGLPTLRARRVFFREGLATGRAVEFVPLGDGPEDRLSPSDRIVVVGLDRLRDGDPVRLEEAAVPASTVPESRSER